MGIPTKVSKGISIHALREEGDYWLRYLALMSSISIHALREEGDPMASCRSFLSSYFYPRPPRGGRQMVDILIATGSKFLSTPSARRATGDVVSAQHIVDISIHALREEGDSKNRDKISIFL